MAGSDYKAMSESELRGVAQRRYFIKRGFYYHFGVFLVVCAVMLLLYFLTGEGYPWFAWPIGLWGLFIVGHIVGTINSLRRIDGKPSAVDREMNRLRKK
ncbi:MAG: 2TM domain-containing protein [Clostridia bacterium]|nr:2TM domain-containing protein [Clostridia bacterium]MBT7121449.1 2TM domain-containing protein [Clostridia bacterium]